MYRRLSCIIRTLNEVNFFGHLMRNLRDQAVLGADLEIIVVDSGSTDGTVNIAKKFDVNLIEIPKAKFNYSKALNLGIESSSGDLIVMLSAHSIPCNSDWLYKMTSHFSDGKVTGVYCRQIPWPDANYREVLRISDAFGSDSRVFSKCTCNKKMHFSNAASCIRRNVWEKHPFAILPAAEDYEWAQWAIENGYTIVYEANAAVYHSHNESCRRSAKRMIQLEKSADIRFSRKRNLVLTIKQSIGWFIRSIKQMLSSTYCKGKRDRLACQCLACSFWYIVDFNRKSE